MGQITHSLYSFCDHSFHCFLQSVSNYEFSVSNLKFLYDTTIVGSLSGSKDQCFDPMFILTSDREYGENSIITSRAMTINRSQLSEGKWTVLIMNIYYDTMQFDPCRNPFLTKEGLRREGGL